MTDIPFAYVGDELDLFAHAVNWKAYWYHKLAKYLVGPRVLEVGAGMGATTAAIVQDKVDRHQWLGLEPDTNLYRELCNKSSNGKFPDYCEFRCAMVSDLNDSDRFDTVVYIDVLEHIENDSDELNNAAAHVDKGGYLVVLSPAYQYLYTPFDRRIGHFRRYTRTTLAALTPPGLLLQKLSYLDSVGLLTSLVNRLFLQSSLPTLSQIHLWDRFFVPVSRAVDPLVGFSFGRSVIGVWQRPA